MSRVVYLDKTGHCVVRGERTWRPPQAIDESLARVAERTGFDFSDSRVRAGFGRGHLLDLVVYSRGVAQADLTAAREAAARLVEDVLGERDYEHWVDSVEAAMLSRVSSLPVLHAAADAAKSFPLAELLEVVHSAIQRLRESLPERACLDCIEQATWTMFELEPEQTDDYAAQDDLVLATSTQPEMLKCFLRGAPFHSGRFSRHGEVFCYLKLDDVAVTSAEQRLESRRKLEDALNAELLRSRSGCVVGNGLGLRYSYVNLALTELSPAIDRVREIAQQQRVPDRSWLLFCDSAWAAEWVGVWDDALTPPPSS
jgi:hypothetical protein